MVRMIDADDLKGWSEIVPLTGDGGIDINDFDEKLKSIPTVDAVPVRHGKWARENNYGTWKCSECGCKVNRANPLKGNIWNYNYCPNCGADMRGETNE